LTIESNNPSGLKILNSEASTIRCDVIMIAFRDYIAQESFYLGLLTLKLINKNTAHTLNNAVRDRIFKTKDYLAPCLPSHFRGLGKDISHKDRKTFIEMEETMV